MREYSASADLEVFLSFSPQNTGAIAEEEEPRMSGDDNALHGRVVQGTVREPALHVTSR